MKVQALSSSQVRYRQVTSLAVQAKLDVGGIPRGIGHDQRIVSVNSEPRTLANWHAEDVHSLVHFT